MKITPAHTQEAKEMADALYNEWLYMQLPVNIKLSSGLSDCPPTLMQVREIMSRGFGWTSWAEMALHIGTSHEAHYITDDNMLSAVILKIASEIGYDYENGLVRNMVENSGTGFTPQRRRELEALATPWGIIDESQDIADGLASVTTSSHGGYVLSEERQAQMPAHLSLEHEFYEEDCAANLVQLAFPELFSVNELKYSLAAANVYSSNSIPDEVSPEVEKWFKEMEDSTKRLFGTNPQENKINRKLTDQESKVIQYLAQCVCHNKIPVSTPKNANPTLQNWVECLSQALTVDGRWPLLDRPWRNDWIDSLL